MDLHHELPPKRVDRYRREAKALLKAHRAGDRTRVGDRERFVLADALHVIASEHGHRSWPAFKHALEAEGPARPVYRIGAFGHEVYADWATRLLTAARAGDADALGRLRRHVPRFEGAATEADCRLCLAREYGFRTWVELAETTDRHRDTHYSRLPAELPWKQAEAAINAGDAAGLRELLDRHPGLEHEDPGCTLLVATAQPEAGAVPREVVEVLLEAGASQLDDGLNIAACFDKPDLVGWLLDAGADPAAGAPLTPLASAAFHGSRAAADVLAARTGVHPEAFVLAAAAGAPLDRWFDDDGRLRPAAAAYRPDFTDIGWPGRSVEDSEADVLAEALSLAAHLGRAATCGDLLDRGAEPARAPLYGITPLHFAASQGEVETARLLIHRGAPLDVRDRLHKGTPADWARVNAPAAAELVVLLGG